MISHFECPLNRRFWRSKKVVQVVQVVQIGGEGGGNLDKIQGNSNFFRETVPFDIHIWTILLPFFLSHIFSIFFSDIFFVRQRQ